MTFANAAMLAFVLVGAGVALWFSQVFFFKSPSHASGTLFILFVFGIILGAIGIGLGAFIQYVGNLESFTLFPIKFVFGILAVAFGAITAKFLYEIFYGFHELKVLMYIFPPIPLYTLTVMFGYLCLSTP